jgi:prephenate dehydrogenase
MKRIKKVTIIGVGLIGGSIGKDLRKKRLAGEVMGVFRRAKTLREAKRVGAVDTATYSIAEGLRDADLIILATSVSKIVELGRKVAKSAKKGAIITDVGSTKRYIVRSLEEALPKGVHFIGSHPMAGTEKGGPLNAKRDLFKGTSCFVTKTARSNRDTLAKVKRFWRSLGARPIEISVGKHDKIVARMSQMIHIVASSLVLANKDVLIYAASGFRDTTRIAMSDPKLWKDICLTNNREISKSIEDIIEVLAEFKKAVSGKRTVKIERLLERARGLRKKLTM